MGRAPSRQRPRERGGVQALKTQFGAAHEQVAAAAGLLARPGDRAPAHRLPPLPPRKEKCQFSACTWAVLCCLEPALCSLCWLFGAPQVSAPHHSAAAALFVACASRPCTAGSELVSAWAGWLYMGAQPAVVSKV